jgi:group I intron endonuclease
MEIPKKSGVYCFTNLINGRQYVGASNNIKRRHSEHISPKKRKLKYAIYQAFNKYGLENFRFEVLEIVDDCTILFEKEIFWIETLKPRYNHNKGGLGNLGMEVKESVKSILRQKAKTQWQAKTDEQKQNQIKNNLTGRKKGYVMPEEQKQRLRELQIGKKWTESQREKTSAAQKISMKGNRNGNKQVSSIKDGIIIKTYSSAVEASKDFGIHPSCITGVLKGRRKHAGGYKWIYGNKIT